MEKKQINNIQNSFVLKINSIQISNILSFDYKDRIEDCEEITFNGNLNVLIGHNGSGKSNFLEILNKIFKQVLFTPCRFVEEQRHLHEVDSRAYPLNRTIELSQIPPINLAKNKNHRDKPMKIRIKIQLTDNDTSNLKFIQENIDELETLSFEYSNDRPLNSMDIKSVDISSIQFVTFDLIEVSTTWSIPDPQNQLDRFIFLYLRWFNFIQKLITVGIQWKSKSWKPLNNPFAIVSHTSNYDVMGDVYSIASSGLTETKSRKYENIVSRLTEENIRLSRNGEPLVFERVRHLLSYEYKKLQSEHGKNAKDLLSQNPVLKGINELLLEVLKISYNIEEDPMNAGYNFNFFDSSQKKIDNYQFSSGEKAIIHFIFSLYGFELQDGLMMLDEPELHIHPQMQQKLLVILNRLIEKFRLQIIVATHSPVFVNSKTIEGVRRFYLDEKGFTKITSSPNSNHIQDLVRYLDFTKATNILFIKKVILVEGDSDEYFFRFYFDKHFGNEKLSELDFIHIIGVDYYREWKKFFDDWKIRAYFIRDLDKFGGNGDAIESKYKEKIFILKQGDLETYIGDKIKNKLENVIDFCKTRYEDWKDSQSNSEKIRELNRIFDTIISD